MTSGRGALVVVALVVIAAGCRERAPAVAPIVDDAPPTDAPRDAGAAAEAPPTRIVTRLVDGQVVVDVDATPTRVVTRIVDGQVVVEEVPLDGRAAATGGGADGGAVDRAVVDVVLPAVPDAAAPLDVTALEARVRGHTATPAERCELARAITKEDLALDVDEALARSRRAAAMCDALRSLHGKALVARVDALPPGAAQRALAAEAYEVEPTAAHAARVGDAADADNDGAAAIEAYEIALRLEPRNARYQRTLARLRKVADVDGKFASVRSRRFVVRYEYPAWETTAKEVLLELERELDEIKAALGVEPSGPVTVIFYLGDGFAAATGHAWAGGIYDGKIRVRGAGSFHGGPNELLQHELVHAVLALAVPQRVPAWFNEGLAERVARPKGSRVDLLRPHLTPLRPTLAQMSHGADAAKLPSIALYYAAVQDIVDVMYEARGDEGIRRLVARMVEGRTFPEALRDVYGFDEEGLQERWLARYPPRR